MYIFVNACKNLLRNAGRNLLLCIVLLGVISSCVVGIVINQATGDMIKEYKSRFGTKVVLSPDIQKFRELNGNTKGKTLTNEMLMNFATYPNVKSADFMNEAGVCAVDFKEMDSEVIDSGQSFSNSNDLEVGFPTAKVKGYSSPALIPEFANATREIIEGRMFAEKDECIISQELATKNELHVGDIVTVQWVQPVNGQQLTLTIAGIYYDTTPSHGELGDDVQFPYLNRRNEILASFDTVQSGLPLSEVNVSYYLNHPDDLSAFEEEMRQGGLPDTFYANADTKAYQKIVSPVEGLRNMTTIFLLVVLLLGASILIVMSVMSIRERKYEIGVLRAIGMKKGKVIVGFIAEILMLTIVCLVLGITLGSAVSGGVGSYLLKQQTQSVVQENQSDIVHNFSKLEAFTDTQENTADLLGDFHTSLDLWSLCRIISIALFLACIASIAGISAVIGHEPIKILSERG